MGQVVPKGEAGVPKEIGQKPLSDPGANNVLPKDYTATADGAVIGPKGATYRPTGHKDANGNLIYSRTSESGNTRYHTLAGEKKQVGSPNTNTHSQIGQNSAAGKAFKCDGSCGWE